MVCQKVGVYNYSVLKLIGLKVSDKRSTKYLQACILVESRDKLAGHIRDKT